MVLEHLRLAPKDDLDLDEQNHSSRQAGTRRNSSHNTWHEEH